MGNIFGGGGRLLDINEDGKTTFADTWLGDFLGFDGSFGTDGPSLRDSWEGGRRTFESSASGYVSSRLAQRKAETGYDTAGINNTAPSRSKPDAVTETLPRQDTTKDAFSMTRIEQTRAIREAESSAKIAGSSLVNRRSTEEKIADEDKAMGIDLDPIVGEEQAALRFKGRKLLMDRFTEAKEKGDYEEASKISAEIKAFDARRDRWYETLFEKLNSFGSTPKTGFMPPRDSKEAQAEYTRIANLPILEFIPDKYAGDIHRSLLNNDPSAALDVIQLMPESKEKEVLKAELSFIGMKTQWGYDWK